MHIWSAGIGIWLSGFIGLGLIGGFIGLSGLLSDFGDEDFLPESGEEDFFSESGDGDFLLCSGEGVFEDFFLFCEALDFALGDFLPVLFISYTIYQQYIQIS